jgi:hypothetical protein
MFAITSNPGDEIPETPEALISLELQGNTEVVGTEEKSK